MFCPFTATILPHWDALLGASWFGKHGQNCKEYLSWSKLNFNLSLRLFFYCQLGKVLQRQERAKQKDPCCKFVATNSLLKPNCAEATMFWYSTGFIDKRQRGLEVFTNNLFGHRNLVLRYVENMMFIKTGSGELGC